MLTRKWLIGKNENRISKYIHQRFLEGDRAVVEVLEPVNAEAAKFHGLGKHFGELIISGGEFSDEGFEEYFGGGSGFDELGFQIIHQGHQLIYFCDDPALFGQRWNWNIERIDVFIVNLWHARAAVKLPQVDGKKPNLKVSQLNKIRAHHCHCVRIHEKGLED